MTARPSIRAQRVELAGLDGARIADAVIVVAAADYPQIIMFNGDPFLRGDDAAAELRAGTVFYRQVRPYRLDIGG